MVEGLSASAHMNVVNGGAGAVGRGSTGEVVEGEEDAVVEGSTATLYIASGEQKVLLGGARGPLGSRILQLESDALHSSLVARLARTCDVAPIFKHAQLLCRAIPLLLPPAWRLCQRVTAEQVYTIIYEDR